MDGAFGGTLMEFSPAQLEQLAARWEFGLLLLAQTRRVVMGAFSYRGMAAEVKGDDSPVTKADRECEVLLREKIAAVFGADTIVGEEYGVSEGSSEFRWVLDPIDGTRAFCRGVPLFGTLIGIEFRDHTGLWVPAAGICDLPAMDETVSAISGGGCWLRRGNNAAERCGVSTVTEKARSVAGLTALQLFDEAGRPDIPAAMVRTFGDVRGWSDCYGYVLVATGRLEAMIDPVMKPWDVSALIPIVTEAGGVITGWRGERGSDAGNAIAGSPWGWERLVEIVGRRAQE